MSLRIIVNGHEEELVTIEEHETALDRIKALENAIDEVENMNPDIYTTDKGVAGEHAVECMESFKMDAMSSLNAARS